MIENITSSNLTESYCLEERYWNEFYDRMDRCLIESLFSLGIHNGSSFDSEFIQKELKCCHILKTETKIWVIRKIILLKIEPLGYPLHGFMFHQYVHQPARTWWQAHPNIKPGMGEIKNIDEI